MKMVPTNTIAVRLLITQAKLNEIDYYIIEKLVNCILDFFVSQKYLS